MDAKLVSETISALHAARRYLRDARTPESDLISARCANMANRLLEVLSKTVITIKE